MRTKNGLPEHCSWNTDRHGKRRVRFRKAGFSTYLTGTPWSDDFMRQCAAALDGVKVRAAEAGAARTQPGSFDAVAVSYYKLVFPRLKASTRVMRRNIIERFRVEHGNKPVRLLKREHIEAIIECRSIVLTRTLPPWRLPRCHSHRPPASNTHRSEHCG
jgi:hypothetical protein